MDLPPDKAKLLKSYDDDKKWDLICDQVRKWCFKFDVAICRLSLIRYKRKSPELYILGNSTFVS